MKFAFQILVPAHCCRLPSVRFAALDSKSKKPEKQTKNQWRSFETDMKDETWAMSHEAMRRGKKKRRNGSFHMHH